MKLKKATRIVSLVIFASLYTSSVLCEPDDIQQIDSSKSIEVPDASIDAEEPGPVSSSSDEQVTKPSEGVVAKESTKAQKSASSSTKPAASTGGNTASSSVTPSTEIPNSKPVENVNAPTSLPAEVTPDALSIFMAEAGVVSDGSRMKHPERGISMVPPSGWKVRSDMPGSTFFLKAPPGPAMSYPRNISVIRFPGPSYADQSAAEKMTKFLVENFPTASASIANYALRNFQKVQTTDKRDAILIYADFQDKGERMMQANVMVSGQDEHYLISYTDRAAHFEDDTLSAQFFNEPWSTLMSVELTTPAPVPTLDQWPMFVAIGVSLVMLVLGMSWFRRRRSQKLYESYSNLDANDAPISGSQLSLIGQDTTGDSMVFKKHSREKAGREKAVGEKSGGKKSGGMMSSVMGGKKQPDQDIDIEDSLDKIQPSSKLDSRIEDELDDKVKNWKLG